MSNIINGIKKDLVSIILPAYNREKFLPHAIDSILKQTYNNLELIIINDGSSDNTEKICKNYSILDKRVIYFSDENKGPSAARNRGISQASGDYLMFLDDDDIFMVYAVEKLLSRIKMQDDSVKIVFGDIVVFSEKLNLKFLVKNEIQTNKPEIFIHSLRGNVLSSPSQMIIEKNFLINTGLFDESFKASEEYELWTRLILECDVKKINVPVVFYRKHGEQITMKNRDLIRYFADKACNNLFNTIISRCIKLFDNPEDGWENLGKYVFYAKNPLYDTAIDMLKFAQSIGYKDERQNLILSFEEKIPELLNKEFNTNLRIKR